MDEETVTNIVKIEKDQGICTNLVKIERDEDQDVNAVKRAGDKGPGVLIVKTEIGDDPRVSIVKLERGEYKDSNTIETVDNPDDAGDTSGMLERDKCLKETVVMKQKPEDSDGVLIKIERAEDRVVLGYMQIPMSESTEETSTFNINSNRARISAINKSSQYHNSSPCHICGSLLTTRSGMRRHLLRHTDSGGHKCSWCTRQFVEKHQLETHMAFHFPDRKKITQKCNLCDKEFSTKFSLRRHLTQHMENERVYKCEMCSSSFQRKADLNDHIKGLHLSRTYTCRFCTRQFRWRSSLKKHTASVHSM